jgi:hypothetical protein
VAVDVWPLLAAVKCRKPDVVRLLVEDHGVRSRCDSQGRSELHALAESQRGPFPPFPVSRTFIARVYVCEWRADLTYGGVSAGERQEELRIDHETERVAPGQVAIATDARGRSNVAHVDARRSAPLSVRTHTLLRSYIHHLLLVTSCRGDVYGATPFHIACSRGNWPAVQHVLQRDKQSYKQCDEQHHNGEINQQDCEGETGLRWAARSGRRDVVALLLGHQDIDATSEGSQGTAAEVLSFPRQMCNLLLLPTASLHAWWSRWRDAAASTRSH